MKYVVVYQSCNGDVNFCEFITDNYNEAVGFIENAIFRRKKEITRNNQRLIHDGKKDEIDEIVDVTRYEDSINNSYHLWILRTRYKDEIEEEIHYLYFYDEKEGNQ